MRSAKSTNFDSLDDLLSTIKDANKEQRTQGNINSIVTAAFGSQSEKSLITPRINLYFSKNPVLWSEEFDSIVSIFSPSGELLSGQGGLLSSSDYPTIIESKILPKSVLEQFSGKGDKRSTILKSLKRELGDKYFINNWQWFWCHLAHALVNHPEPQEKRTFKEDEQEDELFFTISRNPYLMIARKALLYNYRKDSFLLERMRGIMELYIIQELLYATRRREGRTPQLKYQLKSQCLGMMFLLIYSRKGKLQGQTLQIYSQYFMKATEYYSAISNQGNSHNIRNLVRTWTYLLTRQHALDSSLIRKLDNANSKDGWYRLARCPLDSWLANSKKTTFSSHQIPTIISIRKNIFRLLSKHNQWIPSLSFLAVLQQFFYFDLQVLHKYLKKQQDKEENQIVRKSFERILISVVENGGQCRKLEKIEEKLNILFKNVLSKKIEINFQERSQEAREKLSRSNRELSKSISYQSPRIRNVWEHPIQQNEYYILFKGAYWVSQQLDRLIPGHQKRSQPCLNLRIFSNPFIFLIFFLLMAITIKTLLT